MDEKAPRRPTSRANPLNCVGPPSPGTIIDITDNPPFVFKDGTLTVQDKTVKGQDEVVEEEPETPETCAHCGDPLGDGYHLGCEPSGNSKAPESESSISSLPVTQKALGIHYLINTGSQRPTFNVPQGAIIKDVDTLEWYAARIGQTIEPRFARPCPTTPRHGFVDSRMVHNGDELRQVWNETKAADSGGELVLMDFIPSDYNMVLANGGVTVGTGHDGATSAVDRPSLTIPCAPTSILQNIWTRSGIKDSPFVEAVVGSDDGGGIWLTQLRDGPRVEGRSKNYVPRVMKDSGVAEVMGRDLLDWEASIKRLGKQQDQYVVWLPNSSLSNHYAIHAISQGIAVITDAKKPAIGTTLEPSDNDIQHLDIQPKPFRDGFLSGLTTKELDSRTGRGSDGFNFVLYPRWAAPVISSLYLLHNMAYLNWDDEMMSRWLGWSIGGTCRLAFVACKGEARYGRRKSGAVDKITEIKVGGNSRDRMYAKHMDNLKLVTDIPKLYDLFGCSGWSKQIGGRNWQNCTGVALELWNTTIAYMLGGMPTRKGVETLFPALNNLINVCHNGSKMLTKYVASQIFDLAAAYPDGIALWAAPIGYELFINNKFEETTLDGKAQAKILKPIYITREDSHDENVPHGPKCFCDTCCKLYDNPDEDGFDGSYQLLNKKETNVATSYNGYQGAGGGYVYVPKECATKGHPIIAFEVGHLCIFGDRRDDIDILPGGTIDPKLHLHAYLQGTRSQARDSQ